MTDINRVTIPMFEFDNEGAILPNPVFHRPWDKLHSRTIEYPFTASQLGDAQKILDVGSVKGGTVWTDWLESLSIDVHVTDYDADEQGHFKRSTYHQADVRDLPIEDNVYDKIFAVSVIEHIGMGLPQVADDNQPETEEMGDVVAFKELLRVLKPGGTIVMTFPFGTAEGAMSDSARIYSHERLKLFNDLASPIVLDYYEYQHNALKKLYIEFPKPLSKWYKRLGNRVQGSARVKAKKPALNYEHTEAQHFGLVTWRRIPIAEAQASNKLSHVNGLLCAVWQKKEDEQ